MKMEKINKTKIVFQTAAIRVFLILLFVCLQGCKDIEYVCHDDSVTLDPRQCGGKNLTEMYSDALESKGIREIRYKGNLSMNVTPQVEVTCSNGSVVNRIEECGLTSLKSLYEDAIRGNQIKVNYHNNHTFEQSITSISKLLQTLDDDEVSGLVDRYLAELACVGEISHNYNEYLKYSMDNSEEIEPKLRYCIDYLKEQKEPVNYKEVKKKVETKKDTDFTLMGIIGTISFIFIMRIIYKV
jgi:hypothetical protein